MRNDGYNSDTPRVERGDGWSRSRKSLRRSDPWQKRYPPQLLFPESSFITSIVLITGISPESIGSSIALSIASQAPDLLILASRTQSKLEEVLKNIHNAYPEVHVAIVSLDLMSQDAVKAAAAEIASLTDRLDLIINNAGIMTPKRQWTKEGVEGQFGANHIGHFLLTNLLLPQLLAASQSNTKGATRVVNLTSLGHRLSPVRFSDYNFEKTEVPPEEMHVPLPPMFAKSADDGYNGYIAYGQGKTANILFSVGLNERLGNKGIISYAVHPGCKCPCYM
jgi:NAD(P)-dependent dehydrogenase (short-subunit alcohol dehydrogenase family)